MLRGLFVVFVQLLLSVMEMVFWYVCAGKSIKLAVLIFRCLCDLSSLLFYCIATVKSSSSSSSSCAFPSYISGVHHFG